MTREELHKLVWDTPMSRLGPEYGMTGNGLAKICKRFNVPYPGRGHWAKKEAGKKVTVAPLPRAKAGFATTIAIARRPPGEGVRRSAAVQSALDEAQAKVISFDPTAPLTRPHAIIAGWLAEHARKTRDAKLERDPFRRDLYKPSPFTEQDHRRHRFLDALFKELERRGARVRAGEGMLLIAVVDSENVTFKVREKMKQARRPLNSFEQTVPSVFGTSRVELQPSGFLRLSIESYLDGTLRRDWLEKPDDPIEGMLPKIVATILAAGPALAEQKRKFEELRKLREAESERREAEVRARHQEAARWRALVDMAGRWRELQAVRDFVAAMRAREHDPDERIEGRSIAEWIAWAEERLEQNDPLGDGVAAAVRRLRPII